MRKEDIKLILREIIKEIKTMNEMSYDIDDEYYDENPYGGWLDPNGKFHAVRHEGHAGWARRLLIKLGMTPGSYETIYKLGFIRVYLSNDTLYYDYNGRLDNKRTLSPRELKLLKDLAIEYGRQYLHDSDLDKRIDSDELLQEDIITEKLETVVGSINMSGEIHSNLTTKTHTECGIQRGKCWRYNEYNETIYWTGDDSEHDKEDEIIVANHLYKKYGYHVKKNVSLESSDDFENQWLLAHGLKEDMSYEELLKLTTPERKEKAANVNVRSLPVSVEKNGEQWNFRYKSSPQTTITDKPFRGSISFLKDHVDRNDNTMKLKCKVDCGCPDFMYRFAYNDASKNASQVGPDSLNKALNRKPKPAYDYGEGLCKHLVALGGFLKTKIQSTKKSNLFEALDEVSSQSPFNVTYYD